MLVGGFELVMDDGAEEGGELGVAFAGGTVNPGERMGEVDFSHITMMLFDPPRLADAMCLFYSPRLADAMRWVYSGYGVVSVLSRCWLLTH